VFEPWDVGVCAIGVRERCHGLIMVQGRSIFLDRPTLGLGGIHETFFHALCKGIARAHLSGDYRGTIAGLVAATWRDDWVRNVRSADVG
jgi:hypothetical protein